MSRSALDRVRGATPFGLAGVLVVLGVFRPVFPDFVRDYWQEGVLALAISSALGFFLHGRRQTPSDSYCCVGAPPPTRWAEGSLPWMLAAVFPLVLAVLYLQPQRVASDGIFYYAPLRSVVVDFDLDFENEYRTLGAQEGYLERTETGRLPNNYSIGPAIFWSPFFLAVHALAKLGLLRATGYGYPYFTAIATGTALYGFLGVLWTYAFVRAYVSPKAALVGTAALWLGSFHFWYMSFEPSMSHALAMASVSAFLLMTHRGVEGTRAWALAGAVAGVVLLVRWQNVVFLPVGPALAWARRSPQPNASGVGPAFAKASAGGPRRNGSSPKPFDLAVFAGVAAVVFLPQAIYWRLLYGAYLLVPQGTGYLAWDSPRIFEVLFSSRHGLMAWTPLVWLGLAGLVFLYRREKVLCGSLLVAIASAVYVNACVFDWWAGASFSGRRFDGALPALALGIAVCVERAVPWVKRHPVATAGACLAPFVFWNWILMAAYGAGGVPLDGPVSFRQAAFDGGEVFYRVLGYPFSLPGAVRDRLADHVPLAVYDLSGARASLQNVDVRMGDTDALFLGKGWSLPRRRPERTFREVSPEGAFVYVTLKEKAPYRLSLEAAGAGGIDLFWNGSPLDSLTAPGGFEVSESAIPAERVRAGLNVLELRPAAEGLPAEALAKAGSLRVSRLRWTRPGELLNDDR